MKSNHRPPHVRMPQKQMLTRLEAPSDSHVIKTWTGGDTEEEQVEQPPKPSKKNVEESKEGIAGAGKEFGCEGVKRRTKEVLVNLLRARLSRVIKLSQRTWLELQ